VDVAEREAHRPARQVTDEAGPASVDAGAFHHASAFARRRSTSRVTARQR
jgi:hypothetical protein